MKFGRALKIWRGRAQLTQDELAKLVGYDDGGMISLIEQGKKSPSLEKAQDLANALNTTVSVLLGEDSPRTITHNTTVTGHFELQDSLTVIGLDKSELAQIIVEVLHVVEARMRERRAPPDVPLPDAPPEGR